jgi:hypothetical protein
MSNTILQAIRQSPRISMNGASLRVCPSVMFLGLLMIFPAYYPLQLFAKTLMVVCYVALWLAKLQAQLWLVRRLGLGRVEMQLSPFVAHIKLDPNVPRSVQAEVHMLGLCVLFGAWAVSSLLAGIIEEKDLRWMLNNLAKCALVSAVIAAIPVFGLDGAQILRWNRGNARLQELLGYVGMIIALLGALYVGAGALYMLSVGILQGALLFTALVWGCLRVAAIAADYSKQAQSEQRH